MSADRTAAVFPGWVWVAVAVAFPIAGVAGRAAGGRVDEFGAALLGGVVTGAVLGAAEWFASRGQLGKPAPWIAASAVGYGLGLAAGAALVDYGTALGELAAMGAVSGAVLGAAQAMVLTAQGKTRLATAWGAAMPVLFAVGWSASTLIGVDVDKQWTLFGAAGAIIFMLLSGLLLARFAAPPRPTP
jgi:hypothetical protein